MARARTTTRTTPITPEDRCRRKRAGVEEEAAEVDNKGSWSRDFILQHGFTHSS